MGAQLIKLKLRGVVSLVNPGGEQLSLQDKQVPGVLLWASMLFFASWASFSLLLVLSRRGRSTMHLMMLGVLLIKAFVLLLWWFDWRLQSRTGSDSFVGDVGWQL